MLRGVFCGAAALFCAASGPIAIIAVPGAVLAGEPEHARTHPGAHHVDRQQSGREDNGIALTRRDVLYGDAGEEPALLERTITKYHAREMWIGTTVSSYGWSIYSGLTMAPFGNAGVQSDGWRLRVTSSINGRGNPANILQLPGVTSSTDLLLGYHKSLGPLTLKAFLGASMNGRAIAQYTSGSDNLGGETTVLGALETWTNITPRLFLSLDGSYADRHGAYSFGSRLGYRWSPAVSFGPELAAYGNDGGQGGRLGLFARLEWDFGEASIAGGVTGSDLGRTGHKAGDKSRDNKTAYGSLTWVHRF